VFLKLQYDVDGNGGGNRVSTVGLATVTTAALMNPRFHSG